METGSCGISKTLSSAQGESRTAPRDLTHHVSPSRRLLPIHKHPSSFPAEAGGRANVQMAGPGLASAEETRAVKPSTTPAVSPSIHHTLPRAEVAWEAQAPESPQESRASSEPVLSLSVGT